MMTVLLESSKAPSSRRGGWTVASVSLHAALIAGAVALTAQAPPFVDGGLEPPLTVLPYVPVDEAKGTSGEALPGASRLPSLTIEVPNVPAIDVNGPIISINMPGDIFKRPGSTLGSTITSPIGGAYTSASVERLATPLPGNGAPAYPGTLRTAGLEGSVVVTFVVDTAGRAEPTSIIIVSATHTLFADAVRQWLGRTRYAPADIRGIRVRQLVQQEVGFTLK